MRFVPGDIHIGCDDMEVLDAAMSFAEDESAFRGCDLGGTITGDFFDSHAVSRHPKKAARLAALPTMMHEVERGRPILKRMADWPLGTEYTLGNHEDWVEQLVDANPGLANAPGLEFANLFGLNDIEGLTILPFNTWLVYGDKVQVHHGKGLPAKPAAVAAKYPDAFTLYGHTHQAGVAYRTVYNMDGNPQVRGAMNVGFLGAIPEYTSDPDWQWSFGLVEFFGDKGDGNPFFRANLHHVFRDRKGKVHVA